MKKAFSLQNLIYFAILSLPTYLWKFKIYSISTNAWEVLAMAVILIWAWRRVAETRHCLVSADGIEKKYLFPIILIFLGFFFSTLANENYATGFGIIKSWFLIPLVFSLAVFDFLGKDKKENVFWALYASSFFTALFSLGYYFLSLLTYDGRLSGFFNSPNYLAMYLAPGIVISFAAILSKKNQRKVAIFFWAISCLPIFVAFYLTYSYAAWFSCAGVFLGLFFIKREIKLKYFLALAIFLGVFLFLQKDSEKFAKFANFNERSSLASRTMIWKSAGKMIKENWTSGIGPGNFQKVYLEYQKYYPPYLEWAVPHPHNIFLAFWLYGGILGIGGFLWLVYLFFKKIFFERNMPVETRHCLVSTETYIFAGIIFYFLLHGIFDTTYFKNDLAVVFWLAYVGGMATKNFAGKN